MITKLPNQLSASYIKRAYQASFELNIKSTERNTYTSSCIMIYNWVTAKFTSLLLPERIKTITKTHAGQEVNIIYIPAKLYFCMKVSHPDTNIAGRIWTIGSQ